MDQLAILSVVTAPLVILWVVTAASAILSAVTARLASMAVPMYPLSIWGKAAVPPPSWTILLRSPLVRRSQDTALGAILSWVTA